MAIGEETAFSYDGEALIWGGAVSTDGGRRWTPRPDAQRGRYDLGGGLSADVARGYLLVFGQQESHEAAVVVPVSTGAIVCGVEASCWLLGEGQVYRPI